MSTACLPRGRASGLAWRGADDRGNGGGVAVAVAAATAVGDGLLALLTGEEPGE